MDSSVHRFGLAGFGSIAENGHVPALQSFPNAQIVAVADVSRARRERAREVLPDAEIFDSPQHLIDRADITALDICAPPGTHAELILAACRRRIPKIVCEKPFVLTDEEYGLVARARSLAQNRIVSVNNWLYSDLFQQVGQVIGAGEIGRVRSIVLRTGRPAVARGNDEWLPAWRTEPSHAGGGIILDHGWHQLYLVMGWMGQSLETVSATARTADPRHAPVEDEAVVELRFPSGTGRLELAWTSEERTNGGLMVGDDGAITIHDNRIDVAGKAGRYERRFAERLTQSSYHADWFISMFRAGILAEDRTESDRNFEEAGQLVAAIRAAYDSANAGGSPRAPWAFVT